MEHRKYYIKHEKIGFFQKIELRCLNLVIFVLILTSN